ncbi:MAG: hypothetical protein GX767_04755 [Firmicutes bacterium]|nr:hypothetical protein [Bacillota bacterium]
MDLDFNMVFRDFGPLDSIVQVAGRCNRHSRLKEAGKVYVARLISEESGYNYSRIYDQVLLKQTHKLLSEHPCFDEKDVPQIVERYYRLIQAAIDSAPIWENISEGYWGEYYPIIEEKKVYEGMLVIDKDGKLEPEIKSILDTKKTLQNAGERRTFFRKLSNHTISVPLELLEEWYQEEGGMILDDSEKKLEQLDENMWLLRPAGINKIYSPEFGFIPPDFKELISF